MRKTPNTRLKKSAFELHYGREPNTEISNLLKLDAVENITRNCFSAKPDTLQMYSFNGVGCSSDQLSMKLKNWTKCVRNCPFLSLEKKITRPTFDSAYCDKTQVALPGTKLTITTSDKRISHRKHISKPISELTQEPNYRGTGLRGPDGSFIKSPRVFYIHNSDSDLRDALPVTSSTTT